MLIKEQIEKFKPGNPRKATYETFSKKAAEKPPRDVINYRRDDVNIVNKDKDPARNPSRDVNKYESWRP